MSRLKRSGVFIARGLLGLNHWGFYVAMVFVFLMCLSIFYEVIMRYVFNNPTIWTTEICGYLVVVIGFMAAAYTLHLGGHVRVEALLRLFPKKGQQVTDVITSILALTFAGVLVWQGWIMAWNAYRLDWHADTLLGTPLFYPQVFVPIGAFLLCIQIIARTYGHINSLIKS